MVNGVNEEYASIMAEFKKGETNTSFRGKMNGINDFFDAQAAAEVDGLRRGMITTEEYGMIGLEMIRDNEDRSKIMEPVEIAADHHMKTGKNVAVVGTPEEPTLVATEPMDTESMTEEEYQEKFEQQLRHKIGHEPDFQDRETIVNYAL